MSRRAGRWRPVALVVAAALPAVLLAGCGGGTPAATGDEVALGHVPGLGTVLVDGAGRTLYLYVPDRAGAPTCRGTCARQWPPLMASAPGSAPPRVGPGVHRDLLGTVARPGGGRQVTYHGWPLYTWWLDTAPGQATGEGDDMGQWYAVSPQGQAVERR